MLFVLVGCVEPQDSGKESVAESVGDSVDTEASGPYPWSNNDAFWTDPGPMAGRLMKEPAGSQWGVRMATSTDGLVWDYDPRYLAYGFSSLDLLVAEEGVILSGVVQLIDDDTVLMDQPAIITMVSKDLETWGSYRFGIGDATRLWVVDPGLRWSPDGKIQGHWFGTDQEGDPAGQPGPHEVFSATWEESSGGLVEDGLVYEYEYLADPSICQVKGQDWLFFTHNGQVIRAAKGKGDGTFEDTELRYDFVNVPYCPGGESLEFYAQNTGGGGPPYKVTLDEEGGLLTRAALYEGNPWTYDNCTSPVVAPFAGKYVLFCAVLRTWE